MDILETNLHHLLPPEPSVKQPGAVASHFDRIKKSGLAEILGAVEENSELARDSEEAWADVEAEVLDLLTGIFARFCR